MNSRVFSKYIFIFLTIIAILSAKTTFGQNTSKPKEVIKEWLPVPFGTIVKMKIEIVDRDELDNYSFKCYPEFLFRVKSVDSIPLPEPIIIEFKESGNFPNNVFTLFKHLYGRDTGLISSEVSRKMKKEYVGKEFNIDGYETGQFIGLPKDYVKYCNCFPPQSCGFGFRHNIVVVYKMILISN